MPTTPSSFPFFSCPPPIPIHHHPLPPPSPSYHYTAAYPPPPPGFVSVPASPNLIHLACRRIDAAAEEAALLAAAQHQAEQEEEIRSRLPREVLNIQKRMDLQQRSVDQLQANLSTLTEMVAQISVSSGKQPEQSTTPSTTASPSTPAATLPSASVPAVQVGADPSTYPYVAANPAPPPGFSLTPTYAPAHVPAPASRMQSDHASASLGDHAPLLKLQDSEADADQVRTFLDDGSATLRKDFVSQTEKSCGDLLADVFDRTPAMTSSGAAASVSFGSSVSSTTPAPTPSKSHQFSIGSAATAHVAPQVFGEMPTSISWQETHGTASDYGYGHQNPIQISCVSNLSEQNLDGRPQQYGFHNLNRQSVFLADGTERSYFALPENYPLKRATLEPVFDVYGDETEDCSNECVDVFASPPEQQTYEKEQQDGDQLLKCFSKALETEHTSAYLNIISDVQDFILELQPQDDERVLNCPVLKASDSFVTSSNQLTIEHSMRELRLLWDPGATELPSRFSTAVGATELHGTDNKKEFLSLTDSEPCYEHGKAQAHNHQWNMLLTERREKWDPCIRKTIMDIPHVVKWSSLTLVSSHLSMLCDPGSSLPPISTKTQKPDQALRPAIHATLVDNFEKLHGHEKVAPLAGSSVTGFSGYKCFSIWIQNNIYVCWKSEFGMTTYISWDPGVLHILDKYTVHNQVQFAQMIAEHLFLRLTTCKQYIAPNDISSVLHATCFTLQKAAHLTQDNYLCSLYCNNVLKTSYVWDPGVKISLYSWFNILTVWSETDKPLSCTHIPDSAAWRNQSVGSGTSYIWDPGTVLWYTFVSLVLATVRDTLYAYYLAVRHSNGRSIYYPENIMCYLTVNSVLEEKEMLNGPRTRFWSSKLHPMQCIDYYQTCNSLSFPHYSHQDITFCEIALWLIHFQPP